MKWNHQQLQNQWKEFVAQKKPHLDLFFWKKYLESSYVKDVQEDCIKIVAASSTAVQQLYQEKIDVAFQKFLGTAVRLLFVLNTGHQAQEQTSVMGLGGFVVGTFNKAAYEVITQIIERKNRWGVIFIYSEPGLGKTHLLKSIAQSQKNLTIYKHANDFGNEVIDVLQTNKQAQEYKKQFAQKEVVLFDDIQILSERKKTNEFLFQIINAAQEKDNADLVFTSDQHPEDLFGFDKRLRSRFLGGLVIKIDYPDLESANKIVHTKAGQLLPKGLQIAPEVFEIIAKTYRKDIRKIEGAIKQLAFCAKRNEQGQIEAKDLKVIFTDSKLSAAPQVSAKKIKSIVSKHSGITLVSLNSSSRKKEIVGARYVAMYLIRLLTNESHATIAKNFKNNNHSTAVNAIRRVREQMKQNPEYAREVEIIKEKCLND